jgi:peptidoglycan/LPS O-acetylase OafA/YrhL
MTTDVKISTSSFQPNYVPELEGLRGLMAWWVVLGHMALFAGYDGGQANLPWYYSILLRGAVPVEVFITISGFVIFFLLDRTKDARFAPYIISRLFRIYPAFIVAFALALLSLPWVAESINTTWSDSTAVVEKLTRLQSTFNDIAQHIGLHLFLVHGLVPDQWLPYAGDAILGPAWSLSLEWQFYLVAPLLFWLWNRHFLAWLAVCGLVLLAKLLILQSPYTFSYGAFLPVKFEFFILGMGSFMVWRRAMHQRAIWPALLPLLIGIVAAYAVMAVTGGMREHFYALAIWLLIFLASLWHAITGQKTWITTALCHPIFQWVGRISYSTYIVHVVVITLVGTGMVNILGNVIETKQQAMLVMLAIGTPLIFGLSVLLNTWVERPGINLGKRINENKK